MAHIDVVKRAAEFCSSSRFQHAAEAKDSDDSEHKHEYKALHDRYLQLFEAELSAFIESEGVTISEFLRECRGVVDGHFTALFEEHEHAWFIDHLLASMRYEHFYALMVREARRGGRK